MICFYESNLQFILGSIIFPRFSTRGTILSLLVWIPEHFHLGSCEDRGPTRATETIAADSWANKQRSLGSLSIHKELIRLLMVLIMTCILRLLVEIECASSKRRIFVRVGWPQSYYISRWDWSFINEKVVLFKNANHRILSSVKDSKSKHAVDMSIQISKTKNISILF